MTEVQTYDCDLQRIPVNLKIDGQIKECYIEELSGKARADYNSVMYSGIAFEMHDGKPVPSMKESQSLSKMTDPIFFLSLCFYNKEDILLTEEEIQKLPDRVVKDLYAKAQELNKMDSEAVEKAKKDLMENVSNGSE